MDKEKNFLLYKWLRIELINIGKRMGFIKYEKHPSQSLIYKTIRFLDFETMKKKDCDINYIIMLIGLMWEHINHEEYDIRKLVVKFLSRIGYPTSAIICDEGFDKEKGIFSSLDSWIDEVSTTINQLNNEIYVGDIKYLLTDFQKRIWDSMDQDKILGISAPTSAGKSFVILLKLVNRLIYENFDTVYIVPTLSLMNQVTEDFNRELKKVGIDDYWISNTFSNVHRNNKKNIYIMTQEKAISAFTEVEIPFSKDLVLVVDEIQNIERMEESDDQRSKILFDTLLEFRYKKNVNQIIISGPRIEKINNVGLNLFGIDTKDHTTDVSPVINLTYSLRKKDRKYYLKQYSILTDNPLEIEIENVEFIKGYGKKVYSESYLKYLNQLVKNIGFKSQNIIFSPTSDTARKIACAIDIKDDDYIVEKDLIDYYASTVRENYALCKTILNGVAYHHGKLPMHVRRTLEKAIVDKRIKTVVCTTTLLQGMNLPAQNIFIRNPHLYISNGRDSSELTNYEMANLRGRAGRLLKDFIGRTYVLDEDQFILTDGYNQSELFDDIKKELPSGYGERFEEYREEIEYIISENNVIDESMYGYSYLVSYIRQTILKYGKNAAKRLKDVGINLSEEKIKNVSNKLKQLSVPKELCFKNRYWDPLVLDVIFLNFNKEVPNSPFSKGAKSKIDEILRFLRDTTETSLMYSKYIPIRYQSGPMRSIMVSLSLKWAREEKLSDILKDDRYSGEEGSAKIDETIELLQNTISYSLPLLLKPIFDMQETENKLLKNIQSGCFHNVVCCMIDMGIPRETAIYLFEAIFENKDCVINSDIEMEELVRDKIKSNYGDLPYWIQIQLDFLV